MKNYLHKKNHWNPKSGYLATCKNYTTPLFDYCGHNNGTLTERQGLTSAPCDGGPTSSYDVSSLCAGSHGWDSASACRSPVMPWRGRCCSTAACGHDGEVQSWVCRVQTRVLCSTPERLASPTLGHHHRARHTHVVRSAGEYVVCALSVGHTASQHHSHLLRYIHKISFLSL